MSELVAVESLLLAAAARDPGLSSQITVLGKSALHALCERAVRDPEPNAAAETRPDLGTEVAAPPGDVTQVFGTLALARAALQMAKLSLADAANLEGQLQEERKKRGLTAVTDDAIRALATAVLSLETRDSP